MEITKKRLQEIIKEELEMSEREDKELTHLMENYIEAYNEGVKTSTVPKEAVIDFLEVLEESRLPVETFEAIINTLSEKKVKKMLKEVLED